MPKGVYPHQSQDEEERFWKYVNKTETCWLWTGGMTKRYGSFNSTCGQYAHRWSYFRHHPVSANRIIPSSICVRHSCDTPACVNPEHLSLGSHADNMRDMKQRKRGAGFNTGKRGEDTINHKLTEAQVREIKKELEEYKRGDETRIALKYKVSRGCIKSIREGKTWIHI